MDRLTTWGEISLELHDAADRLFMQKQAEEYEAGPPRFSPAQAEATEYEKALGPGPRTFPSGLLNQSPETNWVERAGGLPEYIERIAAHLHFEKGMAVGNAVATAVNVVKKMCATGDLNFPGVQNVNAGSRGAACAAAAEWEALKARA